MERFTSPIRLFAILLILGFGLRIAYGVVRYRGALKNLSGRAFINKWDSDALYHVLIAEALLSGKGYTVDAAPVTAGREVRFAGQEALFKAPLYEFFLAGAFSVSGFTFKLFFPLQALFGGLLSGYIGLIALRVFRRPAVAWFAGMAAVVHPILVNAASQPYNEDLFFFLFAGAIWAFLVWFQDKRLEWAVLCGAMIGLCTLTRENGLLLLIAMGIVVLLTEPRPSRIWIGYAVVALLTVAVVLPWTIRNYIRFGIFVPVASILGEDLLEGNNPCVAAEGLSVPYWAEGSCPWVDQQKAKHRDAEADTRIPIAVRRDRLSRSIALRFISENPAAYVKLVFRRLWTTLLPYDPRGLQHSREKIVLLLYWLAIFPPGFIGILFGARRLEPGRILLTLLVILNLMAIAAILYWSDLRFRIGVDLLLACFAGWTYSEILQRRKVHRTGSLFAR